MGGTQEENQNKPEKRGYLQLILVVCFLGGAFAISIFLASLRQQPQPQTQAGQREVVVSTQTISPQSSRIVFSATGTVQVRTTASLIPQVSGKVTSVSDNFYPGGQFKKGQVLFTLEPADYLNEVKRLNAQIAQAQTQVNILEAESSAAIEEWEELYPDEEPTPLTAKIPQLEEARAALRAAQAQVETAKLNLQRTIYSLPYDGRILEAGIEPGQYVAAGQSVGQAYSLQALEVMVPLNDDQMAWLLETSEPDITVQADYLSQRREYKAFLKRIGAERDSMTRFGQVVLGLDRPTDFLVPGIFTEVTIAGPQRDNILRLPLSALQEDSAIWTVRDNKLHHMSPEIVYIGRDYALAQAEQDGPVDVVTTFLSGVTEGTAVRVKKDMPSDE